MHKRKAGRKAIGMCDPVDARTNARLSLELVHDEVASGQRDRVPNVE